ncbi:glycosyltransferase family A protein [Bacillus sp. JCM 19041]|uniref:glycosyltransferase family 2 protein n=1 Tax=Bacillus sp. JCM 19041 TaxID=1460637 RepID=UPI0006D1E2B4
MGFLNLLTKKDSIKNKVGFEVINEKALNRKTSVTVIVPVYNAEKWLQRTVDSVILQNLGQDNITCVLVDDHSTDGSKKVMKKYSRMYENVVSVFLEQNTGTPAHPRNLGAHLANSEYVFFLDADDWLYPTGLKTLVDLLEESNGDYAVGKTIEVNSKSEIVIGRYESSRERRNVSPYSIKHFFYHLGPRARMVRLKLIRDHNITFPEMKFAEDKQFFIDVIIAADKVSTTMEPIYYLNRLDENDSLIKQTDIMQKMDTNIAVLKYVLKKKLPAEKEKTIINRIIEFDSITRLFDRNHFVKSKDKQAYFDKFHEVMSIFNAAKRSYSFEETIIKPINKQYYKFATNHEYEKLVLLAKWSKKNGEVSYFSKDGLPYKQAHLEDGTKLLFPIEIRAELLKQDVVDNAIELEIQVSGHGENKVEFCILQSRDSVLDSYYFKEDLSQDGNVISVKIPSKELSELDATGYQFLLGYNDYEKIHVQKESDSELDLEINSEKQLKLYKTIKSNIGIKIS